MVFVSKNVYRKVFYNGTTEFKKKVKNYHTY